MAMTNNKFMSVTMICDELLDPFESLPSLNCALSKKIHAVFNHVKLGSMPFDAALSLSSAAVLWSVFESARS